MPVSSKSSIAYSSRVRPKQPGDLLPFVFVLVCFLLFAGNSFSAAGLPGLLMLTLVLLIVRAFARVRIEPRGIGAIVSDTDSIRQAPAFLPLKLMRGSFCSRYYARLRCRKDKRTVSLWLFATDQCSGEWRRFRVLWVFHHSTDVSRTQP